MQRALQQYTVKTCCIGQYSALTVSRAHCVAMQQCSAMQRNAAQCSMQPYITIQYTTQYTPPLPSDCHGNPFWRLSCNKSGNQFIAAPTSLSHMTPQGNPLWFMAAAPVSRYKTGPRPIPPPQTADPHSPSSIGGTPYGSVIPIDRPT